MSYSQSSRLVEACSNGSLDPEDWTDGLIESVSNPLLDNRDLLEIVARASDGLDASARDEWLDNLMEFSLWETGQLPARLALCDYMARAGIARISSPKRWSNYGGLLHVACEGGNMESIAWAYEREPSAVQRRGGRFQLPPLHALCLNPSMPTAIDAFGFLTRRGASPAELSNDGRSALFRCGDPSLSTLFLDAGANPWLEDNEGFSAFGFWLELGYWRSALLALEREPGQANRFHPWGSFSHGRATRLQDRPLFILAAGRGLAAPVDKSERIEALASFIDLGCDPVLLDQQGRGLHQRARGSEWLSLVETSILEKHIPRAECLGSAVRL